MVANFQERLLPILSSIKVKLGKIPSYPLQFSRIQFLFINDDVGLGWVLDYFPSSMSSSLIRANAQSPEVSQKPQGISQVWPSPSRAPCFCSVLKKYGFTAFYTRSVICSQLGKIFTSLNSVCC